MNQQAVVNHSAEAAPAQVAERPAALTFQPTVDIRDLGGEVVFTADIPGARANGIDVAFEDGVLTIHATVPPRELPGRPIRQEYGIGNYRRSFRLGEGFDASQITADYARGVLAVRVPRLAAVRPRKVEVREG
ncbi:MAG: Hsp20/alpha crystallin family protein [Planctomycetota bacterium]